MPSIKLNSKTFALVLVIFSNLLGFLQQALADEASPREPAGIRWLKNTKSPMVQGWVKDRNTESRNFLRLQSDNQPNSLYGQIEERARTLTAGNAFVRTETRWGSVFLQGGNLILRANGMNSILVNKIIHGNDEGSSVVADYRLSPDQQKIAYNLVKNGGDWQEWFVMDLATRTRTHGPFPMRFGLFSWSLDSKFIFYSNWATEAENRAGIFYTNSFRMDLQTSQTEMVFSPPQKDAREFYLLAPVQIQGEDFLIAARVQGSAEMPLAVYLGSANGKGPKKPGMFRVGNFDWLPLQHPNKNILGKFIGAHNSKIYIRSSEAGNNFGILSIDPLNSKNATVIVPSRQKQVLITATVFDQKILAQYFDRQSFQWTIELFSMSGQKIKSFPLIDLGLPGTGSLSDFTVSQQSRTAMLTISDVHVPSKTLLLNFERLNLTIEPDQSDVNFDSDRVIHETHWILSLDRKTKVPVEIYRRKDQTQPKFAYLTYYGYIGIPQFGQWNKKMQLALELGGIVAIAHHRGGGELGLDWQMGVKINRLPSYEDTVAAARWLKSTWQAPKVVVTGRSFGGLHTMALMTQHNEEFDAYVPVVGVSDMNEFLSEGLFGFYAADDFGVERDSLGQLIDNKAWRAELLNWSPLFHVHKIRQLKPTFMFTADTDERTNPEQSYYFAEALRMKFPNSANIHIFTERHNGHSARSEAIDEMAFIAKTFDIFELRPLTK